MEDSTLAFLIGLMAGSIFFIDGWGPSEKNDDFLKSKRFRGLSILIAGGIITPILDYVTKNQRPKFFLSYLEGSVLGWFFVFLFGLFIYLFWKSAKNRNKESNFYKVGEFAYSILDFIYLGIADNPHLKAKRDSDVSVSTDTYKIEGEFQLGKLRDELNRKKEKPNELDEATKLKIEEYEIKLKNTKTESDYVFSDWYYKGLSEYEKNEYEKTIAYMKNAIEKDKTDTNAPNAHLYMGIAYWRISLFEKSLEQNNIVINQYPNYKFPYIAFINKGISLERLHRYDEALLAYNKSIDLKRDYELAWVSKANLLFELKRNDEAIETVSEAIRLNPEYGDAWVKRGDIFRTLKRYQEAINDYDKAIELRVYDLKTVWLNKGVCHSEIQDFDGALNCYKKSLELKPDHAAAFYNIACVNALMKDKKSMLENLGRAINLDSKYQSMSKTDKDFKDFLEDSDFKKIISN